MEVEKGKKYLIEVEAGTKDFEGDRWFDFYGTEGNKTMLARGEPIPVCEVPQCKEDLEDCVVINAPGVAEHLEKLGFTDGCNRSSPVALVIQGYCFEELVSLHQNACAKFILPSQVLAIKPEVKKHKIELEVNDTELANLKTHDFVAKQLD